MLTILLTVGRIMGGLCVSAYINADNSMQKSLKQ